ncbi:phage protein [Staphylococcus xylosus]|nr:phage protein [Staphylococcus xylosus]
MQYLIRTLTDSTGHPFTHVTQARENETFTVVEAESKEEAERKYKYKKVCPICESWNTDIEYAYALSKPILTIFQCYNCGFKASWATRKDSEING